MTKVLSLRVPDGLAEWADEYAKSRGVTRQALIEGALASFKEDCEAGVPEIRQMARRQSSVRDQVLEALQGVGDCPERPGELGHIWESPRVNPERPCKFCGLRGRLSRPLGQAVEEKPNYLDEATAERAELFSRLKAPMQNGTGDPKKAWSGGMPPEMAARAAEIVEDKRRRDREKASAYGKAKT
jgi:predicted transcriptional regulator